MLYLIIEAVCYLTRNAVCRSLWQVFVVSPIIALKTDKALIMYA